MGIFTDLGILGISICIYVGGIAVAANMFKASWASQGFAFAS